LLALIAGTLSNLHTHMLVARHGQPGWVAALTALAGSLCVISSGPRQARKHPPDLCG
jgi:hypothetical protein